MTSLSEAQTIHYPALRVGFKSLSPVNHMISIASMVILIGLALFVLVWEPQHRAEETVPNHGGEQKEVTLSDREDLATIRALKYLEIGVVLMVLFGGYYFLTRPRRRRRRRSRNSHHGSSRELLGQGSHQAGSDYRLPQLGIPTSGQYIAEPAHGLRIRRAPRGRKRTRDFA